MQLTGNVQGLIDLVGGGSEVEFEQILESGEKIGIITIDNVPTDIYAPEGAEVEVTQVVSTGTKIATIGVDGVDTDLYAPDAGSDVDVTQVLSSGTKIATIGVDGVDTDLYAPTPSAPTSVSVTQVVSTGTKIATIGVDGVDTDLYAPSGGGSFVNPLPEPARYTDFDTLTATAVYDIEHFWNNWHPHNPFSTNDSGILMVFSGGGSGNMMQIAYGAKAGYIRIGSGGQWYAWKQMY